MITWINGLVQQVSEKMLRTFSDNPQVQKHSNLQTECSEDIFSPLAQIERHFPSFQKLIIGKTIVDFGCGNGNQSFAMLKKGVKEVLAVEIRKNISEQVEKRIQDENLNNKMRIVNFISDNDYGKYDFVLSHNSMEHFHDPEKIVNEMTLLIKPNGFVMIIFGPPWLSPYGAHMNFFTSIPWVHLIFSENVVLNVRSNYRNDGATRYEEVEGGLNRMTLKRFEVIAKNAGLRRISNHYECILGQSWLGHIPFLREFCTYEVGCLFQLAKS